MFRIHVDPVFDCFLFYWEVKMSLYSPCAAPGPALFYAKICPGWKYALVQSIFRTELCPSLGFFFRGEKCPLLDLNRGIVTLLTYHGYLTWSTWHLKYLQLSGISPILHNALDRIIYPIFPPFCQVIQRCFQVWKGHNNDLFYLYWIDSTFWSLWCVSSEFYAISNHLLKKTGGEAILFVL